VSGQYGVVSARAGRELSAGAAWRGGVIDHQRSVADAFIDDCCSSLFLASLADACEALGSRASVLLRRTSRIKPICRSGRKTRPLGPVARETGAQTVAALPL